MNSHAWLYVTLHQTAHPYPTFFQKWPNDRVTFTQRTCEYIHSQCLTQSKKVIFLSDLSFIKKWPFIKKQKTLALLINILNIAPILFSTSLCRKFRYKKHSHFLGFDIPISFRTHSDIIPKARNHQKLTTNREQKRTTFPPRFLLLFLPLILCPKKIVNLPPQTSTPQHEEIFYPLCCPIDGLHSCPCRRRYVAT